MPDLCQIYDSGKSGDDTPDPLHPFKVLEAFRGIAVGLERDLQAIGALEVAMLLGAARQAAEEILAAEDF